MILYIQTISKQTEILFLSLEGQIVETSTWNHENNQSKEVLKGVDAILDGKIPTHILVMNGMGSYTGTRIGVAVANALAYGWNISIGSVTTTEYCGDETSFNSLPYIEEFLQNPVWEKMVVPVYNRDPHIG